MRVLRDTFTWQDPSRHRIDDFLGHARDEEIYVAVEHGELLGLAGFYRSQNFLHSLYVAQRGRGVGKALLDHVIAQADGPVSLKVQAPNLKAREFYRREGFEAAEQGRDGDVDWIRLVQTPSKVN